MKKVFGQIGRLKRECIDEYRRLHEQDVYTPRWKGVLDMIHDCNMRNYSIFIEDDVVFGLRRGYGQDGSRSHYAGMVEVYAPLLYPVFRR